MCKLLSYILVFEHEKSYAALLWRISVTIEVNFLRHFSLKMETEIIPVTLLWWVSFSICPSVAATLLVVVVATKSLNKWLQNLIKFVWPSPEFVLLGKLKNRNKLAVFIVRCFCSFNEPNNLWEIFISILCPVQSKIICNVISGIDNTLRQDQPSYWQ